MKKTIKNLLFMTAVIALVVFSHSAAFAQYDDWTSQGSSDDWISIGSGNSTNYDDWTSQGSGYTNYTGGYSNPTIDYVSTGCVGCTTNYDDWTSQGSGYTNYTGGYSNPTIDYVTCTGCSSDGGSYVPPVIYDNGGGYIGGGYVGSTYGNGTSYIGVSYGNTGYVGSTYIGGGTYVPPIINNTVCSDGLPPVNGSCTRTHTIPVTNNTICSDGLAPVNGSCVRTNTIPTTTNTICSDGLPPTNGSCVRTNTLPTTITTLCSDGTVPVNGSCNRTQIIPSTTVRYQTCWDGSVIPTTSVCATQFKVCANGTSVPVNQACYVPPTPVYTPPVVTKFNNVVTSIATQITNSSARCNGIGLIANGAQSSGWFEYGETANLGRTTAQASIGSANTAPFSNMLVSLKPATKYYCRAVMQNQYGLVKGEIVSFVTKEKEVKYVKPVQAVKKPATKTAPKKNDVTCSDGTTVSVKNESAATLLAKGDKLVAVQIDKTDGALSGGSVIHYKVSYKNLTDSRLTGVVVKVALPQEFMFTSATVGTYDALTRTLTLNQDTLDPYTEGVILVTATVLPEAALGKSVVSNVYALYTVPSTKMQDEVTAYSVGSIVPQGSTTASKDTGAKKVVGLSSDRGFMPNSLIEWLALLAILFIIFILGRSIYASLQDEGEAKH